MPLIRRFAALVTLVPAMTGPLVVAPVFTHPAAAARPVHAVVVDTPLDGSTPLTEATHGARSLRSASNVLATVERIGISKFTMAGVTWRNQPCLAPVHVTVSVHSHGQWTPPTELEASDISPDKSVARTGTEATWVDSADGVRVRVLRAGSGPAPQDVKVSTIDPGSSSADANTTPSSSAEAATGKPTIVSRAGWGADESIMNWDHQYSPSVKVVFVHHTDGSNTYSKSQAAAQVRGIYAYHARSLGWGDIGYNFLVDRFGTIYEGRSGGIDTAVIGGHTYGFNSETSGIGLIGTFLTAAPSAAMMSSLEKITAWKLSRYYRNPQSTQPLTAGITQTSGTGRSYVAGRQYPFNVISGHRDGYSTACPGNQVYGRLATVRTAVAQLMGPRFYDPVATPIPGSTSLPGGVSVSANMAGTLSWTVAVQDATNGVTVATIRGRNSGQMKANWTLSYSFARVVLPGTYKITLSATDGRTQALPATFTFTLTGNQGGQLYPAGTFLQQGSSYWRVEQKQDGTIQRRPVLASALQSYPNGSSQAVSVSSGVLAGIPVGPVLGWAEGTVVNALHDTKDYVVSQGQLRLIPADPGLTGWGYTSEQVLVVPGKEVNQLKVGPALRDPNHPAGSYLRTDDGRFFVVVSDKAGSWFLRPVVSDLALRSWIAPISVVAANASDLALPEDAWQRGIADGTVVRLDGGSRQFVVSQGVARAISDPISSTLGFRPPIGVSSLDLGHLTGSLPAIGGVEIATRVAGLTARTDNPNGVVRSATWNANFYGTAASAPAADPARP